MYVVNGHCIQYLFSSNERHASAGQSLNDHILFMEKQNPQINKRTRIIIQSIQSVDCRVIRLILIFFSFYDDCYYVLFMRCVPDDDTMSAIKLMNLINSFFSLFIKTVFQFSMN